MSKLSNAVGFWIPNLLGGVLPPELIERIEDFTEYNYYEWDQSRRQNLLNQEILMGCRLWHVTTMSNTKHRLNNELVGYHAYLVRRRYGNESYCADCGQYKHSWADSIRCRREENTPCREVKFDIFYCHECCELNFASCNGNDRQCSDCTVTFGLAN